MKKIILFGISIALIASYLFCGAGCSAGKAGVMVDGAHPYALGRAFADKGDHSAAWREFSSVKPEDPIFPAAVIAAFRAAYEADEPRMAARSLNDLAPAVTLYPFLTDFLNFHTVKLMFYREKYSDVLKYAEYGEAVSEEDLKKEITLYTAIALYKTGKPGEAFRKAAPLLDSRLPGNIREPLKKLIRDIVAEHPFVLHPGHFDAVMRSGMGYRERKTALLSSYDGSASWWKTAARTLRRKDMLPYADPENGYWQSFAMADRPVTRSTEKKLKTLLDDPDTKYKQPLAAAYLVVKTDAEALDLYFSLLDDDGAAAVFKRYFTEYIRTRDFESLYALLNKSGHLARTDETKAMHEYWKGRCLQERGEKESAKRHFKRAHDASPFSYYGAESALQCGIRPFYGAVLPENKKNISGPLESTVKYLAEAGYVAEIVEVQKVIPPKTLFESSPLFIKAYGENGRYAWLDVTLSHLLSVYGPDREIAAASYPTPYRDIVQTVSRDLDVPEALIYAVMRQESRFTDSAVSSAGAKGLMQIMDATFGDLLAIDTSIRGDIFDPRDNIRAGALYLQRLVNRFKNIEHTLASYNAGPRRVSGWLNESSGRPRDEFVELIPFRETRGYVKRVFANMLIYNDILGGKELAWATVLTQ